LTPAIDREQCCRLRRGADGDSQVNIAEVALRSHELELGGFCSKLLRRHQELRASRVAACSAVIVWRIPGGPTDEEYRVRLLGNIGVSNPDRLAALLSSGAQPIRQPAKRVAVFDDDRLHECGRAL